MNCFRDRWSINKVRQSVPFLPSVIDGSRQFTMPIGPDLFRVACGMGLEGLVSKGEGEDEDEEPGAAGHDACEGCGLVERVETIRLGMGGVG
jgi:hypothetical protein